MNEPSISFHFEGVVGDVGWHPDIPIRHVPQIGAEILWDGELYRVYKVEHVVEGVESIAVYAHRIST